jgi:hypothetical protein
MADNRGVDYIQPGVAEVQGIDFQSSQSEIVNVSTGEVFNTLKSRSCW